MTQKLIITGPMRSGTTLLANFLNTQDSCLVYRDFLRSVFEVSTRLKIHHFYTPIPSRAKNIILRNLKAEMQQLRLNILQDLTPNDFTTLKELLDVCLKTLISPKIQLIGLKVTENADYLPKLLEETDFSIIYMLRDLRDVLLSSANYFVAYNIYDCAKKWNKGLKIVKSLEKKYDRLYLLKFEDLLLQLDQEVRKLSDFLKIELKLFDKDLKDLDTLGWQDNSAFHDINKLFDSQAVYRWKKELNSHEVKYGSKIYRKTLKELEYEELQIRFRESLYYKGYHLQSRFRQGIKRIGKAFYNRL